MGAHTDLIDEVENAIANGSAERRSQILERVTDLFVLGSGRLSEDDIALFDDVIGRLATKIERTAQVLLANRLAPIPDSPPKIIRALAFNDAIDVAGPVLSQSARLDDETLVELATQKGQDHLLAITRRASLSEAITDVLVKRGDRPVVLGAVGNRGARFSDRGFSVLVQRCEHDDGLAASIGARPDVPPHLLLALIARASQGVRAKLDVAHPQAREAVGQAVIEAAHRVQSETLTQMPDYAASLASVESLEQAGRLDENALREFAKSGGFIETGAALAALCDLPLAFVEQAMASDRSENILVLGRAIGLSWPTVEEILSLRVEKHIVPQSDVARCLASFERLRPQTAQEIVRYYRTRSRAPSPRPA